MKWTYLRALLIAFLTSLSLFIDSRFSTIQSPIGLAIVFVMMVFMVLLIDWTKNKVSPDLTDTLGEIVNSCARDAVEITTVSKFLVDTGESALHFGDEVRVLTNSLEGYDLTPAAVSVIAGNLQDGVKYIYFLPRNQYPTLEQEKDRFVDAIMHSAPTLPHSVLNSNLVFHKVEQKCLFNFATVTTSNSVRGYWYITRGSGTKREERELVILELNKDLRDRLLKIFSQLSRVKTVSATSVGLDGSAHFSHEARESWGEERLALDAGV